MPQRKEEEGKGKGKEEERKGRKKFEVIYLSLTGLLPEYKKSIVPSRHGSVYASSKYL